MTPSLPAGVAAALGVVVSAGGIRETNAGLASVQKNLHATDAASKKSASGQAAASAKAARAAKIGALGIAGAAVISANAWQNFEGQMNKSLAIMDDVSGPMRRKMEAAARSVGRTTEFSATQAAEGYFFLASAGMDAEASLAAMPRVARFATAGNFDLATATDLSTDALSAMGMKSEDAAENLRNLNRVQDVFVKSNQLANTSVQQVSEAFTNRAGPALRGFGKEVEEGAAVLAAMADQGVKGRRAGMGLAIVLRDLNTQARKNADAFQDAGVRVFDQSGNMRNMAAIIGDLEGHLQGMTDKQKGAAMASLGFTDRSVQQIQSLLGTSDAIREYERELRRAGGATDEVADKNISGFHGALVRVKGELADLPLRLASAARDAIEWLSKTSFAADVLLGVLAGGAAVLGAWAAGWLAVKTATTAAAVAQAAFNLVMNANPMVRLVTLIAMVAGALVVLWKRNERFREIVGNVWSAVQGAFEAGVGAANAALDWLSETFGGTTAQIVEDTQGIQAAVVWVAGVILDVAGRIVQAYLWVGTQYIALARIFVQAGRWITNAVINVVSFLEPVWRHLGAFLVDVVTRAWAAIRQVFRGAVRMIGGVVKLIDAILRGNFRDMWDAIKQIFSGAIEVILGMLRAVTAPWRSMMHRLGEIARDVWGGIRDTIKGAMQDALDFIRSLPGKFRNAGQSIAKALANALIGVLERGLNAAIGGPVKFINKVFDVVSKAPFVSRGDLPEVSQPSINIPRLARGGVVNAPMAIVGEEAPAHPEYVIPTNPAYRGRAQGLLADAAAKLGMPGFAKGGTFMSTSYGPPWNAMNGTGVTAAGVDLRPAKKAYGVAVDPNVIPLGTRLAIQPNPHGLTGTGAADQFTAFDTGGAIKGNRIDFYDWRGRAEQMAWGTRPVEVSPQGQGVIAKIGKGVSKALDTFNPMNLINKLPSPADFLPPWLRGMGDWVIKRAKDWILDKAGSLIGGGGGDASGPGVLSGTAKLAQRLAAKFGLSITSGYRDPGHNAAVGGVPGSSHTKGSPSNPGAHDFVPPSSAALRYAVDKLGAKWADIHDFGSGLHLHVSWFRKGGVIGDALETAVIRGLNLAPAGTPMPQMPPFAGSFGGGGRVPGPIGEPRTAIVHGGEDIGYRRGGAPELRLAFHGEVYFEYDPQEAIEAWWGDEKIDFADDFDRDLAAAAGRADQRAGSVGRRRGS